MTRPEHYFAVVARIWWFTELVEICPRIEDRFIPRLIFLTILIVWCYWYPWIIVRASGSIIRRTTSSYIIYPLFVRPPGLSEFSTILRSRTIIWLVVTRVIRGPVILVDNLDCSVTCRYSWRYCDLGRLKELNVLLNPFSWDCRAAAVSCRSDLLSFLTFSRTPSITLAKSETESRRSRFLELKSRAVS